VAKSGVLREYLLALGWKVDDAQWKKVQGWVTKTTEVVEDLALAFSVTSAAINKDVLKVAESFAELYYSAQRVGTTVRSLQNFQFAARMVGVSASQAMGQIEGFARSLRLNPGLVGYLNALGISTRGRDPAQVQLDLLTRLKGMQPYVAAQIGQMFGIDPDTLQQELANLDKIKQAQAERQRMFANAGLDPDQLAANSAAFERNMLRLDTDWEIFKALLAERFLPAVDALVSGLNWLMAKFNHLDSVTGGASTYAGALGGLVGSIFVAKGARSLLARLLGKGGAAAAGGGTAGAAGGGAVVAEAGGAGILAEIVLPVVVAVLAALGIGWLLKQEGLGSDIAGWARSTTGGLWNSTASAVKNAAQATKAWASDGLDAFTKHYESLSRTLYGDGKQTDIGYGHRVLPGEKFPHPISDAEANALYQGDMAKSKAVVARLAAGLGLSSGWKDALADFQYNTGNVASSKMLKYLRTGDNAAALKSFEAYPYYHDKNGAVHYSQNLMNRRLGEESMARAGVNVQTKTDIHIVSSDPLAAARATAREQRGVTQDLVRHAVGAAN
jgi:GH24 family phage-related lysozyme (muramidase)